jgi:hypothetical protein
LSAPGAGRWRILANETRKVKRIMRVSTARNRRRMNGTLRCVKDVWEEVQRRENWAGRWGVKAFILLGTPSSSLLHCASERGAVMGERGPLPPVQSLTSSWGSVGLTARQLRGLFRALNHSSSLHLRLRSSIKCSANGLELYSAVSLSLELDVIGGAGRWNLRFPRH